MTSCYCCIGQCAKNEALIFGGGFPDSPKKHNLSPWRAGGTLMLQSHSACFIPWRLSGHKSFTKNKRTAWLLLFGHADFIKEQTFIHSFPFFDENVLVFYNDCALHTL